MEILICDRRQSVCFRDGEIFRKYFKYGGLEMAKREAYYSSLFEKMGIATPRFIATGFSETRNLFYNDYSYTKMSALTEVGLTDFLLDCIGAMVEKVSACGFSEISGGNYWRSGYKNDLKMALEVLERFTGLDFSQRLNEIFSEPATVPIHGDFSVSNMGLSEKTGELLVFDFHMAGCGIRHWDLAYFIGSSSIEVGRKMYARFASASLLKYIKLVTAVKMGRSLRRHDCSSMQHEIFQFWRNFNDDYADDWHK